MYQTASSSKRNCCESTEQLQGKRTDHEEILVNDTEYIDEEPIDDEKDESINCSSCLG